MRFFITLGKIVIQLLLILSFAFVSLFIFIFVHHPIKRRDLQSELVSFYCKLLLFVLGAKVKVTGLPSDEQHYFLVGNHLGFLDILVISSIRPTLFITSVDMKETPGLGHLTQLGGCLYVERRNRNNISNEIQKIRETLLDGHNVVLFPEAASTNGERVLPFKKSLITAAAGTSVPIMPFVINFRKVNGEVMSHKWRDFVFWYGDISFFSAGWKTHSLKSFEVEIEFLAPVICHNEEERREVVANIQTLVESKYVKIPVPKQVEVQNLSTSPI